MSRWKKPKKDKDKRRRIVANAFEYDLGQEIPQWAYILKNKADKIMSGTYKRVYIYKNEAISIEVNIPKEQLVRRLKIYDMIKKIPECNVNYPSEYFNLVFRNDNYFISKLRYCPLGDLFDNIMTMKDLEPYEELYRSYYKLHEAGLYHIDVKPENLLVCKCEDKPMIAIADIEDALIHTSDGVIKPKRIVRTRPYAPLMALKLGKRDGFTRDILAFCDYYAVSLIILLVYALDKETEEKDASDIVINYQTSTIIPTGYVSFKRPPASIKLAQKMFNTQTVFTEKVLRKIENMYGPNPVMKKPVKEKVKNFFRGMMGFKQKLKI